MDDQTLQALSKALTLLIFRNGAVENCAASEAILDDVTMKILNKDIPITEYAPLKIKMSITDLYGALNPVQWRRGGC